LEDGLVLLEEKFDELMGSVGGLELDHGESGLLLGGHEQ
jgi:hypothetical protein